MVNPNPRYIYVPPSSASTQAAEAEHGPTMISRIRNICDYFSGLSQNVAPSQFMK